MSGRVLTLTCSAFLLALFLLSPGSSLAQEASALGNEAIVIRVSPETPRPGESVELSATSIFSSIEYADISWSANGKEFARGENRTAVTLPLGPLGSETRITAVAQTAGGAEIRGETTIRPVLIDIVWDTNSLVPPFFRGRALAGPGSTIRAQAIVNFMRADGTLVPESDITYMWRAGDKLLREASGRGRSRLTLTAPFLFDNTSLSVEAASQDGTFRANAATVVPSADTVLALYVDHPLYGTLYHDAITGSFPAGDTEVTVSALPYYTNARSARDDALRYAWQVNGRTVVSDAEEPNKITVATDEREGYALIELSLSHRTSWTEAARGTWNILLSSLSGALDAFRVPEN